jgi:hypothetical protein
LPAHWDTQRERIWADKRQQSRRVDFDKESWIAGQLATARAGLQLLQARVDPHATSVWPEFAEYDCAACHHMLAGLPRGDARQERPGRLVWGSWNYLPTIIGLQLQGELAPLEQLPAEMARLSPNRAEVSRLAAEGLVRLDGLQKNIEAQTPGPQRILARLRQDQNGSWDRANHLYLATAALSGSYHDAKGSELREKLEAWRRYLEKPDLEFDDSRFREALEELLKQAP